jgi:hypothetical protein
MFDPPCADDVIVPVDGATLIIDGRIIHAALQLGGFSFPQDWLWPMGKRTQYRGKLLYLARAPGRMVKIGISDNPIRRMRELDQETRFRSVPRGNHRILAVVTRAGMFAERLLHQLLSRERVCREWFGGINTELMLALLLPHAVRFDSLTSERAA